jgi:hypothetical protein
MYDECLFGQIEADVWVEKVLDSFKYPLKIFKYNCILFWSNKGIKRKWLNKNFPCKWSKLTPTMMKKITTDKILDFEWFRKFEILDELLIKFQIIVKIRLVVYWRTCTKRIQELIGVTISMNQSILSPAFNKDMCQAFGCFA